MTRRNRRRTQPIPQERALVIHPTESVVEEEKSTTEEVVEQAAEVIKSFAFHELKKDAKLAEVPVSPNPYYIIAKNGTWLQKQMLIGRGIIPTDELSPFLAEVPNNEKYFYEWTGPQIPANICGEIVSFFRRIYDRQKGEAEVLLLLNSETNEWKVWIPTQRVTGASVDSRYEPSDIPDGFVVVGSMHSHCNMGAFHSGTDIGDAEEFDGLHITIGKITSDPPQYDVMIMMNKIKFSVKNVALVADFSEFDKHEAPPLWDNFVESAGKPAIGNDLFAKYPKTPPRPRYTPPTSQPYQQPSPGWWKNRDNNNYSPAPGQTTPYQRPLDDIDDFGDEWDEYLSRRYGIGGHKKKEEKHRYSWLPKSADEKSTDTRNLFESPLHDDLVTEIVESGIFFEEELETIEEDSHPLTTLQAMAMVKFFSSKRLLEKLGFVITKDGGIFQKGQE